MPQGLLGRLGIYLAALAVILVVGSCGTVIVYSFITQPDSVRVHNDTGDTVVLFGCNHTIGWNGQREIRPGKQAIIRPRVACSVFVRGTHVACLSIPAQAYKGVILQVSEADQSISESECRDLPVSEH